MELACLQISCITSQEAPCQGWHMGNHQWVSMPRISLFQQVGALESQKYFTSLGTFSVRWSCSGPFTFSFCLSRLGAMMNGHCGALRCSSSHNCSVCFSFSCRWPSPGYILQTGTHATGKTGSESPSLQWCAASRDGEHDGH